MDHDRSQHQEQSYQQRGVTVDRHVSNEQSATEQDPFAWGIQSASVRQVTDEAEYGPG